jgi:hypothetical protein
LQEFTQVGKVLYTLLTSVESGEEEVPEVEWIVDPTKPLSVIPLGRSGQEFIILVITY